MKNSELFLFVSRCLSMDDKTELNKYVRERVISDNFPFDRFVRFCDANLIIPVIYSKLKASDSLAFFPDELVEHFENIYALNKKRNNEIINQIDTITVVFTKNEIVPVFLKGTANLMDKVYHHSGDRMIGDIDFLVKEVDYLKAADLVINKLGYITETKMYDDLKTLKDYPRLFREDVPADIEIHRVPVSISYSEQFSSDIIFKGKILAQNQQNSYVPDNEHRLIHTFIHSQLGNKGHMLYLPGFRDIYDAWLLSKRINLEEVIEQIEEKEKARIFFEYMQYLFSPDQDLTQIKNKSTLNYIKRHQWFLNHPGWHKFYIKCHRLYELVFITYLKRIVRSLFNKQDRIYIINRLKDPKWYKRHFKGVSELFK